MWIGHVDPLFMFSTFLLILVTLSTITEQVPSGTKKFDWEKCAVEMKCFCSAGAPDELLIAPLTQLNTEDECKIGVQSRFFADDYAMFQFQVDGDSQGRKLSLVVNDKHLVGCEANDHGKVELIADYTTRKKYKMTLFEDRSRFEKGGYSLCAFKAERVKDLYDEVHVPENQGKYKLILVTDSDPPDERVFSGSPNELFDKNMFRRKCDPYSFEDKLSLTDFHVLPVMNRDDDHLDCSSYEDDSYTMRYDFGMKKTEDLTGLTCTQDPTTGTWHYVLDGQVDENGEPAQIAAGQKYTIYCAAPIGKVCQNPFISDCPQGPECPTLQPGLPSEPLRLTCPDRKWRINDEYLKLTRDPECKADPTNGQNAAAFFISEESGVDRRVDGAARCFTDYDCNKTAPILIDDSMAYSNGEVACADRSIVMEIHFYEKNETLPATSFACDKADGQWKNKTSSGILSDVIPAGSQLRCTKPDNGEGAQTGEVTFSEGAIIGIIVGSSVGFLIVVALILFGVLYYKKHRRVKTIDKEALRKMDQAERIRHCREFFPMVLNTTPVTVHHIIDGLIELDVLLEMEIEDLDVWEVVYPFIMRIHGAIFKMDRGVGLMLNRYLYLGAKAIIDKHGWTCKKPIRKSNTDGLIRCVAINLLSFAVVSGDSDEALKLILKGFRELGFRGRSQYPHCGLLWSVFSFVRMNIGRDPSENGRVSSGCQRYWKIPYIRIDKFHERLKKLSARTKDIPPDETIPHFGSVAEQAIFAHGGWQNLGYHVEHFGSFVKKLAGTERGAKIATAYVAGMACSLTRCPASSILLSTMQFPSLKPEVFAILHKTATAEEWGKQVEKALPICHYYGRHMDANRLEERFITNSPEPSAKFLQMRNEQEDFIATMDKQLEEMREWCAEHTDKDEYKKKPVYIISDKFKQLYRNSGPTAIPNLKAGDGPKSAGETKSNSGGAPTGKSSEGSSDSKNTPEKPAPETPAPAPATPGPPSVLPSV